MARGKKKGSALTSEEKLAQALVPVEEQPYQVPGNWCWLRLETVASLYNGDRGANYPSKKDYVDVGIPFINAGAIQNNALDDSEFNYITEQKYESLRAGKIQKGDILYCLRGSLGKIAIVETDIIGAISSSLCILRGNEAILRKYFAYLLQSDVIRKQQDNAENGSAQPNLSAASVLKYMLPIPSLPEQQRIVDRIEYLFAKLDEAKEKAQSVLDSFETRKAAILHKAFTGELTAKWRAEHGGRFDAWRTLSVSDIGDVITGSTPDTKKPEYYGGEVPFVKPTELNQGRYVEAAADTLTEAGRGVSRPVRAGSTCVCCIGATISKCGFLMIDAVTNQQINTIVPYSFMDDAFVYYYCISNRFKNSLIDNSSSTTLPIINKKKMSALEFVAPPKEEQTEIVRILDSLFAKEQQAKEAAEAVLEKIDLLKKSILARAFRGELGTNDPNDESAVELLKKIL